MDEFAESMAADKTDRFDPYSTKSGHSANEPTVESASAYPFLAPPKTQDELGRLGHYRVQRLLGKGGMGMVFKAEDVELQRPVALKVILPEIDADYGEATQRFLREARALAALKHEHLVTVYQAGRDRNTVFMAMELLEGETLDAWLKRIDRPSIKEILRVGKDTAEGLAAIHERGLIHRDIKPANIWVEPPRGSSPPSVEPSRAGRIKILDFGLVRNTTQDTHKADTHLTATGAIMGTPAYLSPEQGRGKPLDQRSDLFSLGCVLYRMCTGTVPFTATNMLEQLAALAADTPRPIQEANPSIPTALAELTMALLSKKPEDRPASAADVVRQLGRIQRSLGLQSKKTIPGRRATTATDKTQRITYDPRTKKSWLASTNVRRLALVCGLAIVLTGVLAAGIGSWRSFGNGGPGKENGAGGAVPLLDVAQLNVVNWPFPKGMDKKGPPGEGKKGPAREIADGVVFQGKRLPQSIFMHPAPPFEPPASIAFKTDKRFRIFKAVASMNDTAPPDAAPVVFSVFGDGKLLWQSKPIARQADAQTCEVAIGQIGVLRLEVQVSGEPMGSHAVWLEPVLLK